MVDTSNVAGAQARPAVVAVPAEMDIASSRRLGGALGSALTSASTVIVDMSATTLCDSSGARILLLAHEQAAATGVELRLVVTSTVVLRILGLLGVDRMIPVFPSLEAALAAEPH